jgi:hypothetical protein
MFCDGRKRIGILCWKEVVPAKCEREVDLSLFGSQGECDTPPDNFMPH